MDQTQATRTTDSSREDLSRLRAIAEEGRHAPLLGGRYLLLWGGIVAVAATLHWGIANGRLGSPLWALPVIWFGLAGLGAIAATAMGRRDSRRPAAATIGNKVERAVWVTAGALLATISVALFLHASLAGDPAAFRFFAMMPPLTFGVYAVALSASAVAGAVPRLKAFAILSLGFAAATTLTIGESWLYLVAAAGAVCVSIVPGILQLRAERRATGS